MLRTRGRLQCGAAMLGALGWLLQRCPILVDWQSTLLAAVQHCTLAQLQEVWGLLLVQLGDGGPGEAASDPCRLDGSVLDAAARSTTPDGDAVSKVQWVLGSRQEGCQQQGGCYCTLREETAAAAVTSGHGLARVQWLHQRGCPLNSPLVLEAALRHADCSVADWLVAYGEVAKRTALEAAGWPTCNGYRAGGLVRTPLTRVKVKRAMRATASHGQLDMVRAIPSPLPAAEGRRQRLAEP